MPTHLPRKFILVMKALKLIIMFVHFMRNQRELEAPGLLSLYFPLIQRVSIRKPPCREIGLRLRNLSARTLLFLRKIVEIEYRLPDLTGGVYLREEIIQGPARQLTVIGQNKGKDEDENWLIFERSVPVPDGSYHVRVEIGFRLETKVKDKSEGIARIKDARW